MFIDTDVEFEVIYYYSVSAFDVNGNQSLYSSIVDNTPLSIAEIDIPEQFSLSRAYPNPFNPITNIRYGIPEQSGISIYIYDINGNKIKELYNGNQLAGYHSIIWNADNQPSGLYFVKMTANSFTQTQKLMLVK